MWDLLRADGHSPEKLAELLDLARQKPDLKARVAQKYAGLRESIEKTLNDALVEAIAGEQARAIATGKQSFC